MLKDVIIRKNERKGLTTWIIEFWFYFRDVPFSLFVNSHADWNGLADQLINLGNTLNHLYAWREKEPTVKELIAESEIDANEPEGEEE